MQMRILNVGLMKASMLFYCKYYTLDPLPDERILLSGVLRSPDTLEPVGSTRSTKQHSISSALVRYDFIVTSRREKNANVCA